MLVQSCLLNKQFIGLQQIGGSAMACTLGWMCHCNNMLFCPGAPAIPVCQQGQSERTFSILCLLPDFCVCFLILPPFPDFFSLCVPIFLAILNAVRNSGAQGYSAQHDYATRPSFFEVINHKINNQSSGVATGGPP